MSNATRLRVGVVGGGMVAQAMHLQHLWLLNDRFELARSPTQARRCERRSGSDTG
jgi:hypothetical protein